MAYEFDVSSTLIASIITILIASLFINWAAKLVIDRGSFIAALLTAIIGTILAGVVLGLVGGLSDSKWIGFAAAIATWALVAAIFYRTAWAKGAIIGVIAWLLWFLVSLLVDALFG